MELGVYISPGPLQDQHLNNGSQTGCFWLDGCLRLDFKL